MPNLNIFPNIAAACLFVSDAYFKKCLVNCDWFELSLAFTSKHKSTYAYQSH